MSEQTKAVFFHVSGRVQGVSYRAWTQDAARALGLSGWVRNRADGAVEGVAAGPGRAVDRLLDRLREGPPAARVTGLHTEAADVPEEQGFDIRR